MVSSLYYIMVYLYLSLSHDTWLSDDLQRILKVVVFILKKRFADSLIYTESSLFDSTSHGHPPIENSLAPFLGIIHTKV